MDDINKNNNQANNVYSNGNLELKNIINNASIAGTSDSYFDN